MDAVHLETEVYLGPKVRPMPVWESLLYFAAVTLLMLLCFYGVRPGLERSGLSEYSAYLLSLSVVGAAMLGWTLVAYLAEGNPLTWDAFRSRLRLAGIRRGIWGWSAALGLVMFLSTLIFSPLMAKLIENGLVPLPAQIPDYINPLKQLSIGQVKAQLISQGVLYWIPLVLLLNIFGEELFWRGMVFPRQELRHGKYAFAIHGLIWAFTHLFQYWLLVPILIGSLALSYTVQRTKNTWVGILAHLLNNGLPFLIMIFFPA